MAGWNAWPGRIRRKPTSHSSARPSVWSANEPATIEDVGSDTGRPQSIGGAVGRMTRFTGRTREREEGRYPYEPGRGKLRLDFPSVMCSDEVALRRSVFAPSHRPRVERSRGQRSQ